MPLIGADVEALEALAKSIQTKSDQVGQINGDLKTAVASVNWIGKDADKFKSQWATVEKSLASMQEQLRVHSETVRTNAEQQRTTSA